MSIRKMLPNLNFSLRYLRLALIPVYNYIKHGEFLALPPRIFCHNFLLLNIFCKMVRLCLFQTYHYS